MLNRLLDLIHSSEDGVRNRLKEDVHIQNLSQRLGFEAPEAPVTQSFLTEHGSWSSSQVWEGSQEGIRDMIQTGELTRRHALLPQESDTTTSDRHPSTDAVSSKGSSTGQFDAQTHSSAGVQSPMDFDPRDQYRIFCSNYHPIPSVKSITVFGSAPSDLTQQIGSHHAGQPKIDLHIPEYLVQPAIFEEERCPLAAVYTDFRDYGRRRLAEGTPAETVLGAPEVCLNLLFRGRRPNDLHTPSTWACQYMRLLKDFDIYVSLAFVFTFSRFMRWAIAPSEESYALLPEAMRPTPLQRLVPHHPGVDLAIFPEMRDGLVYDMRDYIVAIQTFGCSVNWPYGLDAAIDYDPETELVTVADTFANHVCNLANWSVSQKFVDVFPELRGYYHIVDQDTLPRSEVNIEEFFKDHGMTPSLSRSSAW
ncbi:hypothetical protein LTR99_008693 [Exophiala xenobiotica]|uniref:Uncharacterized protein n=1 Tax=Vermiconidia calcicola TaxID=1690605 RepID=A0AAV9Q3L4_9PEZI|nr:hypothetical protein LTR92_010705 [Exophiala xenobiotica]KAK5533338.1 hypothetical protein LTR25_007203 [Vermiconidia calcicola]KAK5534292.1 hypothetical protein LTR23_008842 [Chaetothyriales sp. CCFEE 6169]KAK5265557.1 hypothetical protein LTR96_008963 [Exophiala xenobiotica]KAK5296327.1 hypothetical protein LTR99_008693 [Exophiala xenobiotica]